LFALAIAGGAFYGGMNVGKAQAQDQQNSFFASRGFDPNNLPQGGAGGAGGFNRGAGGQGAGFANRGVNGTITKVDGNTVTVTDNQGNTVIVNVTGTTPIIKSVAGTSSDLKVGGHILAIGDRSGNNVSATAIQITDQPNGMQGFFPGGGFRGGPRGTPTPVTK